MSFIIKKISDHGTSNPIVARLSVQTSELMQFYPLSKEKRDKIFEILHENVQPRLLRSYEINKELLSDLKKIDEEIAKEGVHIQASGRVTTVPQIMKLRERCENYLYNAKSALRDLSCIFEPLFGKKFNEARYDTIYSWAKKKFGEDDNLAKIIKQDHDLWIKKVVSMRNVVEHPGGRSGQLHIHNIELTTSPDSQKILFVDPTWHLNNEPRVSISEDFNTFIWNLLEFTEDILVLSLEKFDKKFPIAVAEIPKEERNPQCPVRLRVILEEEFMKKPET